MLHHDGHGDLRLVIGGKADEHGVGLGLGADLGRACLCAHLYAEVLEIAAHRAVGGQGQHTGLHRLQIFGLDVDGAEHLGLITVLYVGKVAGLDLFQQVGGVAGAPVDQGGDIVGQLDGGEGAVLLADGHGQGVAVVPLLAPGLGVLPAGHDAGLLPQLDARLLTQAEAGGVVHQPVNAQAAAHVIEEVVAGDLDGLAHIHQAVGGAVLAVDPTLGGRAGVIGVGALVENLGGGGDDALLQSGDGRDHLEGRAGGIGARQGPVCQGF